MSCDVGEVTESLENELRSFRRFTYVTAILQPLRCFTYVTVHSPTLLFASPMSQALNPPGEPPMVGAKRDLNHVPLHWTLSLNEHRLGQNGS